MPNNVINEITLHNMTFDQIKDKTINSDGRVDFSILLPLPLNSWAGSVSVAEEEAFPSTHLADARNIWGTKWNAYGMQPTREKNGNVIFTFETAWSHPRPWVCAVFNTFECDITAKWLSEGFADAQIETYHDHKTQGPKWKAQKHLNGTQEQRYLHKLLWGVEEFVEE